MPVETLIIMAFFEAWLKKLHPQDIDLVSFLPSSTVSSPNGRAPVKYTAFGIKMWIVPKVFEIFVKALSICVLSEISAMISRTSAFPSADSLIDLAARERTSARRPIIPSLLVPARATDLEMARPIPAPPPVTTTVFPARESSGRVGDIDA